LGHALVQDAGDAMNVFDAVDVAIMDFGVPELGGLSMAISPSKPD
jgi:hypothetical protein